MPQRRLYDEIVKKTLAGSSPFYVTGRPVEKGWVRYITSAHCIDTTQSTCGVAFGKIVGKNFHYMEAEDSAKADIGFFTRNTHHFIADEQPTFYLIDGAAADNVEAYLEGYEVELED